MSASVKNLCGVLGADAGRESTMQQELVRNNQRIDQLAADKCETN